jgi:N-acetylglucosamine-6-phosphate deacetylase
MAAAGAEPGRYTIGELAVEVGSDRVVRQPGSLNLAGSALTMNDAVAGYQRMTGEPLARAWDAASIVPAMWLKKAAGARLLDLGTIIADPRDQAFRVVATLRGSRVLWCSGAA